MTQAVLKVGTLQQVNCFNIAELAARWIQFAQVSASSRKAYDKGIKRLKEYLAANQILLRAGIWLHTVNIWVKSISQQPLTFT